MQYFAKRGKDFSEKKNDKQAIKSAKVEKNRGRGRERKKRERDREGNVKCYGVIPKF